MTDKDDQPPLTASEAHSRGIPVLGAAGAWAETLKPADGNPLSGGEARDPMTEKTDQERDGNIWWERVGSHLKPDMDRREFALYSFSCGRIAEKLSQPAASLPDERTPVDELAWYRLHYGDVYQRVLAESDPLPDERTRQLRDYRPQHNEGCAVNTCQRCTIHYLPNDHERAPGPCSCGLDALLAPVLPPLRARAEEPEACECPSHDIDGDECAKLRGYSYCFCTCKRHQPLGLVRPPLGSPVHPVRPQTDEKDNGAELAAVANDTTVVPAPELPHDETIAALRNSGVDVECGACMEVAFTGVTTNTHTCRTRDITRLLWIANQLVVEAKSATNALACVAKAQYQHAEVARLHTAIDLLSDELGSPVTRATRRRISQ